MTAINPNYPQDSGKPAMLFGGNAQDDHDHASVHPGKPFLNRAPRFKASL